jgi:hypothetical protein
MPMIGLRHPNMSSIQEFFTLISPFIYFAAENLFLWARLETTGDAIEN